MNVDTPRAGLGELLKSLNCDRAYGLTLLACIVVLLAPEIIGEPARAMLSFQRVQIADGEWWRLLSAHFVHLDLEHTLVNVFAVVLLWALFARDYSPLRWAAIYLIAGLAVGLGLLLLNPEWPYYVGASGALHGVFAAGAVAHLRRRDLDAWLLVIFITAKLGAEQIFGPMPFSDPTSTVIDAHLYGAIGGLLAALILKSRNESLYCAHAK